MNFDKLISNAVSEIKSVYEYSEHIILFHLLSYTHSKITSFPPYGFDYWHSGAFDRHFLKYLDASKPLNLESISEDDTRGLLKFTLELFFKDLPKADISEFTESLESIAFEDGGENIQINMDVGLAYFNALEIAPEHRKSIVELEFDRFLNNFQNFPNREIIQLLSDKYIPVNNCERVYFMNPNVGQLILDVKTKFENVFYPIEHRNGNRGSRSCFEFVAESTRDSQFENWLLKVNLVANGLDYDFFDTDFGKPYEIESNLYTHLSDASSTYRYRHNPPEYSTSMISRAECESRNIDFDEKYADPQKKPFDVAIGFLFPMDEPLHIVGGLEEKKIIELELDKEFYSWSYGAEHHEDVILELMLRILTHIGKCIVVVPQRFLHGHQSRSFRETLLKRDWISSIEDVGKIDNDKGSESMALLVIDKRSPKKGYIDFGGQSEYFSQRSIPTNSISKSDYDLRPEIYALTNSEEYQYREIFGLFDKKVLSEDHRERVKTIIANLKNNSLQMPKDQFNPMRKIIEDVYKKIKELDASAFPNNPDNPDIFFRSSDESINLANCMKALTGDYLNINGRRIHTTRFLPNTVCVALKNCQELTNQFSHTGASENPLFVYKSAGFGLLELLRWFSSFVNEHDH